MKAARAAGMPAFAYAGAPHSDGDGMAALGAIVFTRMASLPELLEEL